MIHIRIDDNELNSQAEFACGLKAPLPEGDKYLFEAEARAEYVADCQGCNPGGPRQYGIPLSQVTGADLDRIAAQWRGGDE